MSKSNEKAMKLLEFMKLQEMADHYHTRITKNQVRDLILVLEEALAATGMQQVGDLAEDVVERCRTMLTNDLLDCVLEVYARSCRYGTKSQHDAAMAYKNEIIRRINGPRPQVGEMQQSEYIRDVHDVEQGLIRNPDYAPAKQVGEAQGDCRSPNEMADALERIAGGALSDYEGCEADELHILRCAKLIRDLAANGAAR